MIALIALTHNGFKWPKCLSHGPPLTYESTIMLLLLSSRSRKCFLFILNAWKVIFYLFVMSSHSFFLLKSHEDLQGKRGIGLNNLDSLLTKLWKDQLHQLEHFQNLIIFF